MCLAALAVCGANSVNERFVALIPAAGVGVRFGGQQPKQYTVLCGQTVLQHTVGRFLAVPEVTQVLVVVSPQDAEIARIYPSGGSPERLAVLRCGGATRAESVRNGIAAALDAGLITVADWVLVHDAARCCVPADAVRRLLRAVQDHAVGGLLAVPVADTLKRADAQQQVAATVSRVGLWQAQTPQMFRAGLLQQALATDSLLHITDEASAVEALGLAPLLVEGDVRNLKLTRPQDAVLAELLLTQEQIS